MEAAQNALLYTSVSLETLVSVCYFCNFKTVRKFEENRHAFILREDLENWKRFWVFNPMPHLSQGGPEVQRREGTHLPWRVTDGIGTQGLPFS